MNFHRIIIVDLASLGVGESGDANRYHSVGADTLGHLDERYAERLHLPTLTKLGLGNIRWDHHLTAVPEIEHPLGFTGKLHPNVKANYSTSTLREMFDFAEPLRVVSVFNTLAREGYHVSIISRYISYLANQDVTHQTQCGFDDVAFEVAQHQLRTAGSGMIYVQEPQLQLAAIDHDIDKYIDRLNVVDAQIAMLMGELNDNDLLMVTSSYAQDLTFQQRMTREYLPIILYSKRYSEGHALGIRRTVGDVATTIVHNFSLPADGQIDYQGSLLHQLD